ncbi:hypothetical protein QW71_36395, partial [Paenibacillus sp. IHB B 3415]
MVAAQAAAINDAPIPTFELLLLSSTEDGFPSIEHLTFPFFAIAGNPRTDEEGTAIILFCTTAVRVTNDEVQAVMVAILEQFSSSSQILFRRIEQRSYQYRKKVEAYDYFSLF